jgi:hypothetical protein
MLVILKSFALVRSRRVKIEHFPALGGLQLTSQTWRRARQIGC